MSRVVAIVQVRTLSTRLPRKALIDLMGKPVVQHVIERTRRSRTVHHTVVATTDNNADDELAHRIDAEMGCPVYRGSESDVLERFHECAHQFGADVIVRITADDPFKDPEIIDQAVEQLLAAPIADYCSNTVRPTFPEGLDVEAIRATALEVAYREATRPSDREHVTPFIWRQPERFEIRTFEHHDDLSAWRWTLDRPDDLAFVRAVYEHVYRVNDRFSYRDVIAFLHQRPDLVALNQQIARNEGYTRSVERERAGGTD